MCARRSVSSPRSRPWSPMAGASPTERIRCRTTPISPTPAISSTNLPGKCRREWQVRMLDTIFILYADHEFNASTFAARVTASTLADMYAACTSACATLKGPLHGGANEESMKMLDEIADAGTCGGVDDGCAGEEGEDHGLRTSRLQSGRLAGAGDARDRARSRETDGQGKLGADLREAGSDDGARETSLRERRSLRGAGLHHVRVFPRS